MTHGDNRKSIESRRLWAMLQQVCERRLGQPLSGTARHFLRNLSYVGIGSLAASLLSVPFRIYIGRTLGPEAYGTFAVIVSVAMFLRLPMSVGFNTAMVKYGAEDVTPERQARIISTTYWLIAGCSLVALSLYGIGSAPLAAMLSITQSEFYLAALFAVFYLLYMLSRDTLKSLHQMRLFGVVDPLYVVVQVISFVLLWLLSPPLSFRTLLYSMCISYGVVSVFVYTKALRRYACAAFDRRWAATLTHYSVYASVGGLSFVLFSYTDQLMIHTYMSAADVGIYYVYLTASVEVSQWFFQIFNNVFFPMASQYQNKYHLYRRINQLLPYAIGGGILVVLTSQLVIITLYGDAYPRNLGWMLLFALGSMCVSLRGVYGWLLNAAGRQGVKLHTCAEILLAVVNVALNYMLIPWIGIPGAIVSSMAAYLFAIAVMLRFGVPYLKPEMGWKS